MNRSDYYAFLSNVHRVDSHNISEMSSGYQSMIILVNDDKSNLID